jgi:FtsP/CotA-like multicopper oxidase with cupredoxin domain
MLGAGAAVVVGATIPPRRSFANSIIKEYRLTTNSATVNLTGDGYPATVVWAYDGTVPGPELRVRQGEPVRITVRN